MRKHWEEIEPYRIVTGEWGSSEGNDYGAFVIPGPCGRDLRVIASPGDADQSIPWEHVSVSLPNRCPNWEEMCFIKDKFWDEEETVVQFHPPKSQYINNHSFCLHLWKPLTAELPLPPSIAVGVKGLVVKP